MKEIRGNSFNVAGLAAFANGDGLCFINAQRELEGFRVNRAEGGRLFPLRMPAGLKPGMALYRNNDVAFERILAGTTAQRKLTITMRLDMIDIGFELSIDGNPMASLECEHQQAQKPQAANIQRQLTKLGNTPYVCSQVELGSGVEECFIPSSLLADLRRRAIEAYEEMVDMEADSATADVAKAAMVANHSAKPGADNLCWQPEYRKFPYTYNISNSEASRFYVVEGLTAQSKAYEVEPVKSALVMQCRHCLRYALGHCVKRGDKAPTWHEPLYLRLGDGRRFRLQFQCDECQMNVISE